MFTLLSCAEYRSGRTQPSMRCFDAGSVAYDFSLSPYHPVVATHMCALGDIYRELSVNSAIATNYRLNVGDNVGLAQSRVMVTLAHEIAKRAVGESHLVTVGYAKKLAILCIESREYEEAITLLTVALDSYETILKTMKSLKSSSTTTVKSKLTAKRSRKAARFLDVGHDIKLSSDEASTVLSHIIPGYVYSPSQMYAEISYFLYLLAESYSRHGELIDAIDCAKQSYEVISEVCSNKLNAVYPHHALHNLELLTDLYIKRKNLSEAIQCLKIAMNIAKDGVEYIRHSGALIADITCKMLKCYIMSLPLQTRSLLKALATEKLTSKSSSAIGHVEYMKEYEIELSSEWNDVCSHTINRLWEESPLEFFNDIISRLHVLESTEEGN
jgi:tetratricopeptide (TPR) repeat protein